MGRDVAVTFPCAVVAVPVADAAADDTSPAAVAAVPYTTGVTVSRTLLSDTEIEKSKSDIADCANTTLNQTT